MKYSFLNRELKLPNNLLNSDQRSIIYDWRLKYDSNEVLEERKKSCIEVLKQIKTIIDMKNSLINQIQLKMYIYYVFNQIGKIFNQK